MSASQAVTQVRGLEITLKDTTTCMDKAKKSLLELQKSTSKSPNAPQLYAQFAEFRMYLRHHWDSIAAMLQEGYKFGHSVVGLTRMSDLSPGEMIQLLQSVIYTCEKCINMAQDLIPISEDTIDHAVLKMTVYNSGRSKGRAQRGAVATAGPQSLIQFTNACKELSQELQNIANFFEGHLRMCHRLLQAAKDPIARPPFDEAARYAKQWKADELLILKSVAHIRRLCEAILVSPVPAPGAKSSKEGGCIIV